MAEAHLLNGKVVTELGIKSPAAKFFRIFVKQLHDLANIAGNMHDGKVHEGDDWHDIGAIKIWTFSPSEGKVETLKESIESIDEENNTVVFKLFDGDIGRDYKDLKFTLKVIDNEGENNGGFAIWTIEYEKRNLDIPPPYRYLQFVNDALTNDVDAHLLKA